LLARLFARPANVLVLDEPTNDLDIETLELLEALLQDYSGTVFLVSHDRAFLDNVVTQTIASEGGGQWKEYVGGYSDWLRQRPAGGAARFDASGGPDARPASTVGAGTTAKAKPVQGRKLSFKEQRELDQLPARIAALETEQGALHGRLADPAFYLEAGRQAAPGTGPAGGRRCRNRRGLAALGSARSQGLKAGAEKDVFFPASSGSSGGYP
jgi:ATP-binding cassette subfamily F protein uup